MVRAVPMLPDPTCLGSVLLLNEMPETGSLVKNAFLTAMESKRP